ncbi:hypothetical protein DQ04_00561060 [Trypanosoma grayi]|uniref:hypothetical protein n=1 Tax=Trypanosoma grayi TaxID=71804 RepID=UPI0004F4AC8C|nr:hypothetical protein DQ04_00561060 [Trypanosoma grayi]KEG14237.1 hypothetical protein DQ04_00561060 [Trypanosoma grayi]
MTMLPPSSVQSPCFSVLALVRRFDLVAGASSGVSLQRSAMTATAPQVSSPVCGGGVELVLFPCQLGEPTRPIGWPPAALHACTVCVNESYVTAGIPRCPTRSASHRTLAGLPLAPYMGDPDAPLKLVVTSHGTWAATFLLAWCRVTDVHAVVEQTVARLMSAGPSAGESSTSSAAPPLDSDSSADEDDSDLDVDTGWVEDDAVAPADAHHHSSTGKTAAGGMVEDENLIDHGEVVVTLRCPLSYRRMRLAGKGQHCAHLACFDVATYLESALRSSAWNCPICDGAVFMENLRIDHTLQSALDGLGEKEDAVVLFGKDHREWQRVRHVDGALGSADDDDDDDDDDDEDDDDGVGGGGVNDKGESTRQHQQQQQQQQALGAVVVVVDSDEGEAEDASPIVAQGRKRARSLSP